MIQNLLLKKLFVAVGLDVEQCFIGIPSICRGDLVEVGPYKFIYLLYLLAPASGYL